MVTLTLNGANGDSIALDGSDGFVLTQGLRGLGLTPADLRLTSSAGDGATWRGTRRRERDIDAPVTVLGAHRDEVAQKLRRLAAVLSDRIAPPSLVATYGAGESYAITVHYVAGAETQYGGEAGALFCTWPMTWRAPDPYWVSTEPVIFSAVGATSSRNLLPNLVALEVSSSQALGTLTVSNPGDVDAYPVWTVKGPTSSLTISQAGVGFTYSSALTSSDTLTIDTRAGTVRNQAGTNLYGGLAAAPKLFRLPPGSSTVSIVATGATADTRISGYFNPRRELIF